MPVSKQRKYTKMPKSKKHRDKWGITLDGREAQAGLMRRIYNPYGVARLPQPTEKEGNNEPKA